MPAPKYSPGNIFHPQLNDEFQKIKRAIDGIGSLNAPVTIYSGPLSPAVSALTVNGSPAGPGNGVFVVNAPTGGTLTAAFNATGANDSEVEINALAGHAANLNINGNGLATFGGLLLQVNSTNNARIKNFSAAGLLVLGAKGVDQLQLDGVNITALGPIAAAQVDMTPDNGQFTLTGTGFTAAVTSTATWARIGKMVILNTGTLQGTSNATTFTATGLPAAIQPARGQVIIIADMEDAGADTVATVQLAAASGTLTFGKGTRAGGAWTASGTKGTVNTGGTTFAYLLN